VSSPLRIMTREFSFQLNPCSHSPYVISSLTGRWICLAFCSYSMLLKILPFALYTCPLSAQALQSRSCLSYIFYATMATASLEGS
jgi:hypothetical protein